MDLVRQGIHRTSVFMIDFFYLLILLKMTVKVKF